MLLGKDTLCAGRSSEDMSVQIEKDVRSMGRLNSGGKPTQRAQIKRHCQGISEKYAAMAQDYEELAVLHDEEAKQ